MVKRYIAEYLDETNVADPTEVVKASDYDALAAEHAIVCREVHEGELNECRLEARVQALEDGMGRILEVESFREARAIALSLLPTEPTQSAPMATSETNYNVPPWHLTKIVPGCQCGGCSKQSEPDSKDV